MESEKNGLPDFDSPRVRNGNAFAENNSYGGVIGEVSGREKLRWKMFFHVTLCFSFFSTGFADGMRGPSFEDLMMITNVSYGKGSAFLSVCFVGVIVGSVLCGFVIDRYSKALVLAIAALCHGCTAFLIPQCSLYWTMVLVYGIQGIGHGVLITGCFTTCAQLWAKDAKSASYTHSMQLCAPTGSILAPLVVTPFLSSDLPKETTMYAVNKTVVYNMTVGSNSSSISAMVIGDQRQADTSMYDITNKTENGTIYIQRYIEQRLIIPYAISGLMLFTTMVLFMVVFCQKDFINAETRRNTSMRLGLNEKKQLLPICTRILRLYLIGVLAFFTKGLELSFTQFFPAFLHNKIGWNKVLSSDIISLFWGLYMFGRLSGIVISFRVKSSTHLFVDITVLIVSFLILLVGTVYRLDVLLWMSIVLVGVGISTLSPCLLSWIHTDILSRSGKHNSFYVISLSLGIVLIPIIIGPLIEFDYTRFVYVLLTGSVIFMIHHIWLFLFARMKLKDIKRGDVITVTVKDQENEGMVDSGNTVAPR